MLLDRGVFWDDWICFRQPRALLVDFGRQLGSTWPDFTSWLPYGSPFSVWATRVVMFACFLGVALLALRLSRRVNVFDAETRIAFASLVAVFPAMAARDSVANFVYPVSLVLFMVGWALLDHSIDVKGWRAWLPRLTALVVFFLSFRTASLGMFYIVVIVWVLWRCGATWRRPRKAMAIALRWADVIVLPVAFWVFRSTMAVPSGLFRDYNVLTWKSLKAARHLVPQALRGSLVDAFARMPAVAWWPVVLLVAIVSGIALWGATAGSAAWTSRWRAVAAWMAIAGSGLLLVVLGVYPYLAVEKIPDFFEFNSRHQLLVPFGAALIVIGVIRALTDGARLPRAVRIGLLAAVIAMCAGAAAGDHLSYQREWYKELGMIEAMRQAPQMQDGRAFVFVDHAMDLNINDRTWRRYYEYAGLFDEAFGTHDRFGADEADKHGTTYFTARLTSTFKMERATSPRPDYRVIVERGSVDLRDPGVLARMMWDEWTGSPGFAASTAGTVRLSFQPLD